MLIKRTAGFNGGRHSLALHRAFVSLLLNALYSRLFCLCDSKGQPVCDDGAYSTPPRLTIRRCRFCIRLLTLDERLGRSSALVRIVPLRYSKRHTLGQMLLLRSPSGSCRVRAFSCAGICSETQNHAEWEIRNVARRTLQVHVERPAFIITHLTSRATS